MLEKSNYPIALLYSRQDAATILGISVRAIDYLVTTQQLTTRSIGRRRLIPRSDLDRFARRDHPFRIVHPKTSTSPDISSSSVQDGLADDNADEKEAK